MMTCAGCVCVVAVALAEAKQLSTVPTVIVFVVSSYALPAGTMSRLMVGFWTAPEVKVPAENQAGPMELTAKATRRANRNGAFPFMLHLSYLDAPKATPRYCFVKLRVEAAGRRDIPGFALGLVF